jgi:tetratricopeptide (TPR) repeat protein
VIEFPGAGVSEGPGTDFFISYAGVNEPWARWIAVELERAGYRTVSQVLDFRPGNDFVHKMHEAMTSARRTIVVLSPAYLDSKFGEPEWRTAFADDPDGELRKLVPVKVQPVQPPGLLRTRVSIDLVDVDERTARERLLTGLGPPPPRDSAPFPGHATPPAQKDDPLARFPGAGPPIFNLDGRNRHFTGRDQQLEQLHQRLHEQAMAAVLPVEAVHGLGGVGKSELVREYGYRFASDYDLIWWIPAEQPTVATAALGELARRLGLPARADQTTAAAELFEHLRHRDRWLLIYDNAEQPAGLDGLLPPTGSGHVLVTSRWPAWGKQAERLPLGVLARDESVRFLQERAKISDQAGLDELAELLGDLPLALEEAAAYLDETGVGLDEYLTLVRDRAAELFELPAGDADADQHRVATVWSVSLDRVRDHAPAAEALLGLCAFLGPDVPRSLPAAHPDVLPADLAATVADPLAYNRTLAVLGRYSLATLSPTTVDLHRLVQTVVRARLHPTHQQEWARKAVAMLRAAFPDESWEVGQWDTCERLLPHLLAAVEHAEHLDVASEDAGWLLSRASAYLRGRGQYPQARPLAERALHVTEAGLGHETAAAAERCDELGNVLFALADFHGARTQYEGALQISESALGPDHPNVGTWRGHLGKALHALGDLHGARTQLERAIQISEAALGPDHPSIGTQRSDLAGVLNNLGDPLGAYTQLERAIQISEAALGPHHADVGTQRNDLGLVLYRLGNLDGARTQFERAIQISEAALGPDHPSVGARRCNLGGVLYTLGDLDGARTQFERAIQISEAAVGPDHPDFGTWRSHLGQVLYGLGDLDGARTQYERAIQISEAALGPDHPDIGSRRDSLGKVLFDMGDLDGARTQYERAIQIGEATLGPDHPDVGIWRNNLGNVLSALGDLEGARSQYERAIQIGEATLGPDHPTIGARCNNLGNVLYALGDLDGARAQRERAEAIRQNSDGDIFMNWLKRMSDRD